MYNNQINDVKKYLKKISKHHLQFISPLYYLKNIIKNPNIIVGDYTYYDDLNGVENFEKQILYHFVFLGDKLIVGKFCQFAMGTTFLMNGGNHVMESRSVTELSLPLSLLPKMLNRS